MQARCPYCSSVFSTDRTGVQFCPSCGKQLNVPAPPPSAPSAGGPEAPPQAPGTTSGVTGTVPPPPPPPQHWGAPPPPPGPQAGFEPQPTDWERRGELGLFAGYFGTMKKSLFSPDPFWRSVRPDGSLWDALSFGWINNAIYSLLAMPLLAFQMRLSMRDLPSDTPQAEEVARFFAEAMTLQNMVVFGVLLALIAPLTVIMNAAVFHLALLIVGGAKSGFTATVRALSYGTGPFILSWVPCLNIVAIYGLVLQIWGLARLHRTDIWRPIVAILLLGLFACCCVGAGVMAGGMAAAGSAASP